MLTLNSMFEKLDLIHDMFDTPLICRIQNRVTIDRFSKEQDFILSLDHNNSTLIVPLNVGAPTSMLKSEQRAYFLLRNKKDMLSFTEIKYEYAKKLIHIKPQLDCSNIALSVERVLNNVFMNETLPNINKRDPDNWRIFLNVFNKQGNDVMKFFISLAICKFDESLKLQNP